MSEPWNFTEAERRQFREAHAAAKAAQSLPDVRPGQVWADLLSHQAGRTLRVESIDGDKAVCVILTNSDRAQKNLDAEPGTPRYSWWADMRGRHTRIAVRRMRALGNGAGYRLVTDNPPAAGEKQ